MAANLADINSITDTQISQVNSNNITSEISTLIENSKATFIGYTTQSDTNAAVDISTASFNISIAATLQEAATALSVEKNLSIQFVNYIESLNITDNQLTMVTTIVNLLEILNIADVQKTQQIFNALNEEISNLQDFISCRAIFFTNVLEYQTLTDTADAKYKPLVEDKEFVISASTRNFLIKSNSRNFCAKASKRNFCAKISARNFIAKIEKRNFNI